MDARPTRVLVISSDPLYHNLAGPGIRAAEMARYLAHDCHVTLAAPERAEISIPGVEVIPFQRGDQETMQHVARAAEVVVMQGFTLHAYPSITMLNKIIVVDLYDPYHLENLQSQKRDPMHAEKHAHNDLAALNAQLQIGDFFICASERQRDFWLGALGTQGRLSLNVYQEDTTFRSLIDIVPFGLPPVPPVHQHRVLKGVVQGIEENDIVVLWGGGIWDWLDPLTVIRAMARVRQTRPDVKLFFLGQHHPNSVDVPPMAMYDHAVALAQELDVYNKNVFFNDRWVPYEERANYLLEADIGVSAHMEHIETRFAFRTRLLDYIWAGLPMVVSAGDTLADTVAERKLGHVVPIDDHEAFAEAILDLVREPNIREGYAPAFAPAQHDYAWPQALKPLVEFCKRPRPAISKDWEGVLPRAKKRIDELEADLMRKDAHIVYLEALIKQIQSGRVMQLLNRMRNYRRS